jgi:DNA-binding XRE family transcriptional regulator
MPTLLPIRRKELQRQSARPRREIEFEAENQLVMGKKRPIHERLHECLGEVVSLRRKRLGMSQEELAQESGVDRAFISSVERGKRNPSFSTIASIAHGLRMRFARLVHNCEQCTRSDENKKGA